jgi:hypothetical protein
VELADGRAQPESGSDLDHGVDSQAEELALAHPGAGEDLDEHPVERVWQGPGGGHECGGPGVVEEPGQGAVLGRPVRGEDRGAGRGRAGASG